MPGRPSEDELIAQFFAPLAGEGGLALKDDVARVNAPPGCDLVVTVDALIAGVHFFGDDAPDAIASKALRVNLSDLAAKGAKPLGFLLALALPRDWEAYWLSVFARGLGDDAAAYGCPLLGGDTVETRGPLTLSITAWGAVEHGRLPLRTSVQPGDHLFVSGEIGDGALGLLARQGQGPTVLGRLHRDALVDRYLRPRPRLALREALLHARAAMDVSDGLIGDLAKMLRASRVGADLDLRRVPLSPAARAWIAADPNAFEIAVTGGDDYEVLAAVAPEQADAFMAAAEKSETPVTEIGRAGETGAAFAITGLDGAPAQFARESFSHF